MHINGNISNIMNDNKKAFSEKVGQEIYTAIEQKLMALKNLTTGNNSTRQLA